MKHKHRNRAQFGSVTMLVPVIINKKKKKKKRKRKEGRKEEREERTDRLTHSKTCSQLEAMWEPCVSQSGARGRSARRSSALLIRKNLAEVSEYASFSL